MNISKSDFPCKQNEDSKDVPIENIKLTDDVSIENNKLTDDVTIINIESTENQAPEISCEDNSIKGNVEKTSQDERFKVPRYLGIYPKIEAKYLDLFYKPLQYGDFDFTKQPKIRLDGVNNVEFPFVCDTEFFAKINKRRKGVVGTVKPYGWLNKDSLILVHPDQYKFALDTGREHLIRHPVQELGFLPADYLKNVGYDIQLHPKNKVRKTFKDSDELPTITFTFLGHFLLAELFQVCTKQDIIDGLITRVTNTYSNAKLDMTRRLRSYVEIKGNTVSDSIEIFLHIVINGMRYRVKIRLVDTLAIQGNLGYKALAKGCGVILDAKDKMADKEKISNMHEMYFEMAKEFDEYCKGDMSVDELLENHRKLFLKIHTDLGIEDYFREPALTIGSTIKDLFTSKLCQHHGVPPDDKEGRKTLIHYTSFGSPSELKGNVKDTSSLLSKVFGGRCRHNKPTVLGVPQNASELMIRLGLKPTIETLIHDDRFQKIYIDNDLMGAYGYALRTQDYPIGNPIIEKFNLNITNKNKYKTLRSWLKSKKYSTKNCDLVRGLWTAVISTKAIDVDKHEWEQLKIMQDFLASWFKFRIKEISDSNGDTDHADLEVSPRTGYVKILNNQIVRSGITEDFLDWLFHICSAKQRNEILDNTYVETACYYPKHAEVDTYAEMKDLYKNWQLENTVDVVNDKELPTGQIISITRECNAWVRVNLGELVVDDLLAWRQFYKDKLGKKCPLEQLYKLCTNTHFGDFSSEHINIANVVVGNNVTARCRAMCWYMEKGFNAWQSVTDGSVLDLNAVLFGSAARKQVTADSVVNLYSFKPGDRKLKLAPLAGYNKFELDESVRQGRIDDAIANGKDVKMKDVPYINTVRLKGYKDGKVEIIDDLAKWIPDKLFEHLQNTFPKVHVLHGDSTILNIESDFVNDRPIKTYTKCEGIYKFEIKDIYTVGIFNSSANYLLGNPNAGVKIAARSYEKKISHQAWMLDKEDRVKQIDFYDEDNPIQFFFNELLHSTRVNRSKVFNKKGILKYKAWLKTLPNYLEKNLYAGDSISKVGLLREFSLSQFTFNSADQFLAIEKEMMKAKRLQAQSYESYFLNPDGTLNYHEMVLQIDALIRSGVMSINDALDPNQHRWRADKYIAINHPEKDTLDKVKLYLKGDLEYSDDNGDSDPFDFLDFEDTGIYEEYGIV